MLASLPCSWEGRLKDTGRLLEGGGTSNTNFVLQRGGGGGRGGGGAY